MTHAVLPRTLWFTRCPVPTATGIAADRRWLTEEFAPDGITVRSLQDAAPGADRAAHFTHALPGLFREGGNVPALWARSRGERTRLIGLTWIEERQAVLVGPGSGIRGVEALRGLRLAVPVHDIAIDFWRAMALRGFEGALAAAGLAPDDATFVDVPAAGHPGQWAAELAALRRGDVDAVYVKGALAVEAARREGAEVAVELDELADRRFRINNGTPRPITVHQQLLDDHPGLVDRFLAVLLRAADWATGQPAEVARILGAETGAGADGVAGAYRPGTPHTHRPPRTPAPPAQRAEPAARGRAHGFLPGPVDITAWADPEPLRRATALAASRVTHRVPAP
ncbi:ABC transporter substrate-binding protein [Streptomyces sp. NPDC059802]|uniref:ABC transporter substrate-binding protein n=1 Tax=Streptomyces sp. NPDC059802 TaxID=3346952 RepID=UPI0036682BDF